MNPFLLAILLITPPPRELPSLDAADREFHNLQYVHALALYDSALTTSTDSTAVLWRMARAWVCLADTAAHERKYDLYKKAESCALRAVGADSTRSEAHGWLAAAMGNIAMFEGGGTKVKLAHAIRREVDLAIALDSTNDIAWSILGSFHKAIGDVSWIEKQLANIFLGGLPDGGYAEAEAAFRRAITLTPDVVRNHYELAKVYVHQERNGEALSQLRRAQVLPVGVALDYEIQRSITDLIREMEE